MKKRISIIGSAGIPSKYGGFETLTEKLSLSLSKKYLISVFCSSKLYKKHERETNWKNITRIFIPLSANGVTSIFYDIFSMLKAGRKSDILLILGGSGTIATPILRLLFPKLHIIFHPDGLDWTRQKWNIFIKWFLLLSIRIGCRFSHKIIIDNKALIEYFSKYRHKIEFIAYGSDNTTLSNIKNKDYWLTIARAEKDNNIRMIAEVFKNNPEQNWTLLSNWNSTKFGRQFKRDYDSYKNIRILDANYKKDYTNQLLTECKGYIHGHSSGGTNPTLVSAIWSGKRIICHNNKFNKETTKGLAEYFSDSTELNETINSSNKINPALSILGPQYYSWQKICNQYNTLFESI